MTNPHLQRVFTSVALLPILGWAIFHGDPALSVVITIVACLGLHEFLAMFWPGRENKRWKVLALILAVAIIWAPLAWSGTALVCVAMLASGLAFLIAYDRGASEDAFQNSQVMLFALLYLPFLLRLARHLSATEIILILLTTMAADTGAYYVGSHCGGPKIWPSISPNKTWSGSLGGLAASVMMCLALGLGLGTAHWSHFIALGIALNLAAQVGDFFESALKRWRGIKDSGRILPGHGGILDRIDSLLFALPLYCGLAALMPYFS